MRRIAVITTSRADYGIYRPLLRRLADDPSADLRLVVGGTHLSHDHGHTVDEIEEDGFDVAQRVYLLSGADTPEGVAESMGRGTIGFGESFAQLKPDLVVVLGDRFEMHAACVAAQPFGMPVAHIHGGELTLGAMDDALRHSMTKLSHLHFPATAQSARRLRQMGEEDWRITVSGALALDNVSTLDLLDASALAEKIGLSLKPPPLLVTFHPATREDEAAYGDVETQLDALCAALDAAGLPIVVTAPNADPGGMRLRQKLEDFAADRPQVAIVESLGTVGYFSLMARAAAMVGNSSSGILEAASFNLPVVNIGSRQDGRERNANVIDTPPLTDAIADAIARATSSDFKAELQGSENVYDAGKPASVVIHHRLMSVSLEGLMRKVFVDWKDAGEA